MVLAFSAPSVGIRLARRQQAGGTSFPSTSAAASSTPSPILTGICDILVRQLSADSSKSDHNDEAVLDLGYSDDPTDMNLNTELIDNTVMERTTTTIRD